MLDSEKQLADVHLHEVVVGVGGQGVPTCVQPKGRSTRHREVESYVGGLLRWARCNEFESWYQVRHIKYDFPIQLLTLWKNWMLRYPNGGMVTVSFSPRVT